MFDYSLKKDNFINNKYIVAFGARRTIKYQISGDYYTEDCLIFTNMFLCGKMCGKDFN